jgi:hypothetical protein
VSIADWLVDERSKSYAAALGVAARERLLGQLERLLRDRFPTAVMEVPYDTRLWTARRAGSPARPAAAGGLGQEPT